MDPGRTGELPVSRRKQVLAGPSLRRGRSPRTVWEHLLRGGSGLSCAQECRRPERGQQGPWLRGCSVGRVPHWVWLSLRPGCPGAISAALVSTREPHGLQPRATSPLGVRPASTKQCLPFRPQQRVPWFQSEVLGVCPCPPPQDIPFLFPANTLPSMSRVLVRGGAVGRISAVGSLGLAAQGGPGLGVP